MGYELDWLSLQIKNICEFVAKFHLQKDTTEYTIANPDTLSETDRLFDEVRKRLEVKQYKSAERLLDYNLNGSPEYISLLVYFYDRLALADEASLRADGFTREQVQANLEERLQQLNIFYAK